MLGQGEQTADVVVEHPHVHPLGSFALQDLQNAVPHHARVDDEILQKDGVLCLFQLREHPGVQRLTGGIVPGLSVQVGREQTGAGDIAGLGFHALLPVRQRRQHRLAVPHGLLLQLGEPLHPFPGALAQTDAAEDGEGHDGDDPGYFVIRVAGSCDDGDDR